MPLRSALFIGIAIIGMAVGASLFIAGEGRPDEAPLHRAYSSDPELYGLIPHGDYIQKFNEPLLGGIVSHHLLANVDISKFFLEYTDQEVDTIFLIGPNHYYPYDFPFLTSTFSYETPFGIVETEKDLIEDLRDKRIAQLAPERLEEEHSITSLVPYIAAYFPEARVVPLIISRRASTTDLEKLAAYIADSDHEKRIVIASVDFSHHLYANSAEFHDARSLASLLTKDLASYFKLEVDSPGSLYVLTKYIGLKNGFFASVEQQSSANIFNKYDSEDVTSYVFAHAKEGESTATGAASILFWGDAMLGRFDPSVDVFRDIAGPEGNFMKGMDAIVLNLEGPVERSSCMIEDDGLLISEEHLERLRSYNISHVGTVNNHFDKCPYDDEARTLFEKYVLTPLLTHDTVIQGSEQRIHIVSAFLTPIPSDISPFLERIQQIPERETVVLYLHWGTEYASAPSEEQRVLAKAFIDAGADVIIGHHPHVVQPIETYKNGIIFYSLGNFVSDQRARDTQLGLGVGMVSEPTKNTYFLFPIEQKNGVPTLIPQAESRAICSEIYKGDMSHVSQKHPCIIHNETSP